MPGEQARRDKITLRPIRFLHVRNDAGNFGFPRVIVNDHPTHQFAVGNRSEIPAGLALR